MRYASTTTISRGLMILGLIPLMLSAQAGRPGRTNPRPNMMRVETRMMSHQPPADVETMEEHPTAMKTADVIPPADPKQPANSPHADVPTAIGPATSPFTVAIEGNTSWSLSNNVLNIKVDKVTHNGTGITGSLRLRLWATQVPYSGGSITGYVLGTYQFQAVLQPGQYYHDISVNVPYTAPPDGTYFTTLTLEEYFDSGWSIMSFSAFPNTNYFGAGGSGTSRLSMQGTESWAINNDVVTLKVDKVVNNGAGTTGSLRLRLWATDTVYGGGTIRGYVLGAYQFSRQLGPYQYFYGINQQVPFSRPADGVYHTTLTLEEYTSAGWVIRDYVDFNTTTTFGNPQTNDPCAFRQVPTDTTAVEGVLTTDSCLNNGYRLDAYKFYAAAGSQILIRMYALDFYSYQILFDPNGNYLTSAAEGFADGETLVTITAPKSGYYYLLATSNNPLTGGPGDLGRYIVEVGVN